MKARHLALTLALPLALLGCASYRPSEEVTAQMARTEAVIQQADRSNVAVNSLPQLQQAKDKYAEAKVALDKKSDEGDRKALMLAREAEVDAQYATAKAQAASQEDAAEEVRNGVADLKQEADRNAASASGSAEIH
jgi:hypothetical protein